nr:hypothetical protein [Burkholderiales bacterium]
AVFDGRAAPVTGDAEPAAVALLIAGPPEAIDAWLEARRLPPRPADVAARGGDAHAWALVRGDTRVPAIVVSAARADALAAVARALPHLGRQSWVAFADGRPVARGLAPAQPQTLTLDRDPA